MTSEKILGQKVFLSCNALVRPDNAVALTQWYDNKVVTLILSHKAQHPKYNVQRWFKPEKRYITVKYPHVIYFYTKSMGGVDLADQMIAYC